ncbi:MAG: hypothetical protein QM714_00045 [Nocardioides sp.]|uniref:hypothetical protein n=1 Tax=Nocardioides sp. TaxID=35761 RepID=UPI0039E64435
MSWQLGGTKPWVAAAGREIGHKFGVGTIYGLGSRPTAGSDHPKGLALDFMTGSGTPIANYAKANAGRLGVTYVIWRQHIWSVARSSEGWRLMEDRGDPTSNHMDHVHVSFQATAPAGGGGVKSGAGGGAPGPGSSTGTSTGSGAGGAKGGKSGSGSGPKGAQNAADTTVSMSSSILGGVVSPMSNAIVLGGVLFTGVALIAVGLARITKPLTDQAAEAGTQAAMVAAPELRAAGLAAGATTKGTSR